MAGRQTRHVSESESESRRSETTPLLRPRPPPPSAAPHHGLLPLLRSAPTPRPARFPPLYISAYFFLGMSFFFPGQASPMLCGRARDPPAGSSGGRFPTRSALILFCMFFWEGGLAPAPRVGCELGLVLEKSKSRLFLPTSACFCPVRSRILGRTIRHGWDSCNVRVEFHRLVAN